MSEQASPQPHCLKCGQPLAITQFRCEPCDLTLDGNFDLPPLARLSVEEQVFVTAFVREHGNLKKMESLFDISYPTVKNRLNAISKKLDAAYEAPNVKSAVLDRLSKGEITVEQALELLG
ncbi:MAG: DUF2089 domain-containing protein [Planctomycetota bacterium]|nr:DUF2089 domain-containing protein [Planctomycetota bacterium]